jgi:pilus assembly protein FimV
MSALDDLGSTDALTRSPVVDLAAFESRPMDFDLDFPSEPAPLGDDLARGSASSAPLPDQPMFDLGDSLPGLNFDEPQDLSANTGAFDAPADADAQSPLTAPSELMSFDLSDANLDLETPVFSGVTDNSLTEENPLDTKLSLAEEFRAIGDLEGARSLAEEVLAEASGTLKTKASTFLADLG